MKTSETKSARPQAVQHVAAVIVAAGRGSRAGGPVPKQFQPLAGRAILARTVDRFRRHARVDEVVVVINPDDAALVESILPEDVALVAGGDSRDASVVAGLKALGPQVSHVLIQDGARPLVPDTVIDHVLDALENYPGAAPALAVTDALWRGEDGLVLSPTPRDGLFRAQTPQGFDLAAIRAAQDAHPGLAADDVEVALAAGLDVAITQGHEDNIKVTLPGDFERAEQILRKGQKMDVRLGNGYDVHRFGTGDHVVLCGVTVPHPRGLQGHSDADVGMHAITDAIYGALAEGDIGQHFPPSDPQWKGAASEIFLRHAVELAASRGYRIGNIDCTLVCERPKIGPHAPAMRAALAAIMGLEVDRISVKATTSERLGFTGREEGIASIATATLVSA
ncbi:bifunctional 2-C-methyl-D-erythritol 4-phosphate cytidylyltransferase/2-C-methyl-D-erythritol 2,4-cyclodiphosphate synthase [Aliiruegeria sabulilitoris]|uniref:bifunctional 2-C-methyl-D-erythritol 4-phosphate cytidylyltransferase/2-C-methyl-D-erythritol 2,4-cyclodiphosphate synthase n=1 Tax=Aliiruegeria sabulilitoris TaxID=1510458 RepID=UPI00082ADA4F|nr:bifunctional 2-C-methyl-D-erythritol 4-phosphate cytidylyltransferase/2-C-methyl-D-erythritol 2,4-cyclodiphosphate synthase [Aliiruegeria sabulilitoris]NDR58291.1 bifunctional 2-C-methyl-D-erythritol 4-phosphate cytidylyltransferase/2-C-methyl-D-erythritol 2,4-cyclodiphosphate synthase [Pseudoruegeria sp. M32A2M]